MKSKVLVIICGMVLCSLLFYACGQRPSQELNVHDQQQLIVTDPISWQVVGGKMASMLQHDTLDELVKISFGGTIPKDLFFPDSLKREESTGVRLWYCYNPRKQISRDYPIFFVAFEFVRYDDVQDGDQYPAASTLYCAESSFKYDGTASDEASVNQFLASPHRLANTSLDTIDRTTVKRMIDEFVKFIKPQGTPRKFSSENWSYFQNNSFLLTRFVNQPRVHFVRYYFGFDNMTTPKDNIRLILVPVDINRMNIQNYYVGKQEDSLQYLVESLVLQKSVPPR